MKVNYLKIYNVQIDIHEIDKQPTIHAGYSATLDFEVDDKKYTINIGPDEDQPISFSSNALPFSEDEISELRENFEISDFADNFINWLYNKGSISVDGEFTS